MGTDPSKVWPPQQRDWCVMRTKAGRVDRNRLCKLLGMLESDHDGEVLNAGRMAAGMLREAGMTWSDVLVPMPTTRAVLDTDLARLNALLTSPNVADILKIRLKAMRVALRNGRLAESDRRLMRVLHRKAVIDGAIIDP